jgi:hypothetical protein
MKTHCNQQTFLFQGQCKRNFVAHFNGGNICSDAGGLLLQRTERLTGIIRRFVTFQPNNTACYSYQFHAFGDEYSYR